MNDQMMNSTEVKRLFKLGAFVLIILGIFLVGESLNAFKNWQTVDSAFNSISVTGTGESVSVPDIATFSYSVSADAKIVSDAQATVTKSSDAILAGLKALGVSEKDIKTTDYSVYPKYTFAPVVCTNIGYCPPSKQIPDGYTVNQSVSIKIRNTADAGRALALVGDKGATNISGLTFTTDDPNKNKDEARGKAIDDARAKADVLSKKLGVRIVRVVGYADSSAGGPIFYASGAGMMDKSSASSAPSVPAGENKTTANVTVTYEIK
jgi:uncharacterized protein YggE